MRMNFPRTLSKSCIEFSSRRASTLNTLWPNSGYSFATRRKSAWSILAVETEPKARAVMA